MAQGIPTVYDLVRFRSRLEAKWARFFDFCGWKWSTNHTTWLDGSRLRDR